MMMPPVLAALLPTLLAQVAAAEGVELEGRVHDVHGEPVVEAKLVIYGAGHHEVEATDTDQGGRFRIPSLAPGLYEVEVAAEGFSKLRQPLQVTGPIADLTFEMFERRPFETVVRTSEAPLPSGDGTTTSTLTQRDLQALPAGTQRTLNDVIATQQGVTADNYGAIHVRGNFAGLMFRVDGIPLPAAVQDRLEQLLEPQVVDRINVIVGGLPAEYGQQVGGVIDIQTLRPAGPVAGDLELSYGSYNTVEGQANVAGTVGPVSALAAGSFETTNRGLDPPAASPILHDGLHAGRGFIRLDNTLSSTDHVEALALYAEGHYQIPIDPTVLPLSEGPPNAVRGTDGYGNTPPTFVPYDSNPTELERDFFGAVSWFHDFGPKAQLQVAPFIRYQASDLACDTAGQLGADADPGQTCSDVHHQVLTGGLVINQTWSMGVHDFKAGALVNVQHSVVGYSEYTRDDNPPYGADPTQTLSGQDITNLMLAGVYIQDRMTFGKMTLLPGLRADVQAVTLEGQGSEPTLWGPSARLGATYAFSADTQAHFFIGELWQPPTVDAPLAARVLGLVSPDQPVPLDMKAETDEAVELGIAHRLHRHLSLSATVWGRLSQYTLDDNEVGDTALTADYNYEHGRALGLELSGVFTLGRQFHAFANATVETAEGAGIASSLYLFTRQQLAFTGYQAVDNAQLVTANGGFEWTDGPGTTHLSSLIRFGSGLRTGPTNNATLPPATTVDVSLRHSFELPLRPQVAFDVLNLFNVVYAYRIATGSLAGTAYAPLRQFSVRLSVPLGG
jgi:outer membrane cobalamin receptor